MLQLALNNADFSVASSETVETVDKKFISTFELPEIEPARLSLSVLLQFNTDSIIQPESAKNIFGEKGENLEGKNTIESNFPDGTTGKNANIIMTIDYPNTETLQAKLLDLYNQAVEEMISASNGIIVGITPAAEGDYKTMNIVVSDAWYYAQEVVFVNCGSSI